MRRKLRRRWRWYKKGRKYGYPLCCILRFCLTDEHSGLKRGSIKRGNSLWVPCNIFHHWNHDEPMPEMIPLYKVGGMLFRDDD